MIWSWDRAGFPKIAEGCHEMGVSENWGAPYLRVLIIGILLFRVPYFRKLPHSPNPFLGPCIPERCLRPKPCSKLRRPSICRMIKSSERVPNLGRRSGFQSLCCKLEDSGPNRMGCDIRLVALECIGVSLRIASKLALQDPWSLTA